MSTTAQAIAVTPPAPRTRRAASGAAAVRRLPLCDPQPPFDDEVAPPTRHSDGTATPTLPTDSDHGQRALRLVFALPSGLPALPEVPDTLPTETGHPAPDLRLLPALKEPADNAVMMTAAEPRAQRQPGRRDSAEEEFGPQKTRSTMLPAPTPWAGRLVQAMIEVVSGVRPVSQLVRWTTAPVYEALCATMARPVAYAGAGSRDVAIRPAEVVRSVRVSEPGDGVAEVCAIVQRGPRCRAIALRLEGIDGRWQCTALQIG
jgi:Family of unknown function (DUF6459)